MSIDQTPSGDAPAFAPQPVWDRRGKKGRGLRRAKSTESAAAASAPVADPAPTRPVTTRPVAETRPLTETRTFDATPRTTDLRDPPPVTRTTTSEGPLAAPIGRPRTAKKSASGIPALAVGAGVVALAGLAAAGWYASQPRTEVASLTPGAADEVAMPATPAADPSTTELAANTEAPAAAARSTVTTTVRTPAATRSSTTTTTRTAQARTRPAPAAASAETLGTDASATIPDAPLPYAATVGTSGDAAAATVAPPVIEPSPVLPVTPPVEPAPLSSATSETPATPATPAPVPQTEPDLTTTP